MKVILYTDGAARGNPGPASIGIVLTDAQGNEIEALGEAIGNKTNNEAEYRALLKGLELAATLGATEVDVRTDSLLMAQQVKGVYKVKAPNLKPLYDKAKREIKQFKSFSITHNVRALNRRADALANQALDSANRS